VGDGHGHVNNGTPAREELECTDKGGLKVMVFRTKPPIGTTICMNIVPSPS